jgi:hypothetical protein
MYRRHARALGTFTIKQLHDSIRFSEDHNRTPSPRELGRAVVNQGIGQRIEYLLTGKRVPLYAYIEVEER